MNLRLLQHSRGNERSVIADDGTSARIVTAVRSTRELALLALKAGVGLGEMIARLGLGQEVDTASELAAGRIIAPIDHEDPAHLLMSGTGLTHLGSADARDRMHKIAAAEDQTDSMRIFLEGVERGKPSQGEVGCQPEWFYKGDGSQLVGPGDPLVAPSFAQDGGEEPELAGIYLIGEDGVPYRLGLCLANEFSDHLTERHNYLWLAHSKLRQAALGPELLVGPPPEHVEGVSRIRRGGSIVWEKPFLSGEANMSHSLANLEWHQFKYAQFRRPGDVHVHFFGTATLSFSDGFTTQAGDEFEIEASPFALALRNPLMRSSEQHLGVRVL
ncbi:MAG TPA: AraD1 family protein [Sphingomicrobium sp.]|nr:AraD1 family protein [Sphingomicrobium sp.]